MLLSLALIFIVGLLSAKICSIFKLPSLIGFILAGIIIGPYSFNLLDSSILSISKELRQIALIIILTRAGLNLQTDDLKAVGRPAILMSFLPASFEIIGIVIIATKLLNITILESLLMGSVVAAVSPAILIPTMLKLIKEKYGTNKKIPQLLMAGSSLDDIFVIVLFSSFLSILQTGNTSILNIIKIPTSIILGIAIGIIIAFILVKLFTKINMRDSIKVIIVLSVSFLLIYIENSIEYFITFSALLAIMTIGIFINKFNYDISIKLSNKYSELWVCFEIILFVLVGATVDINYILKSGINGIIIIIFALIFRMIGVYFSILKTNLNIKEKIFAMISYTPKATVQAAIGSIALSVGLKSGEIILAIAVLSIIITAPISSTIMNITYKKLLQKEN